MKTRSDCYGTSLELIGHTVFRTDLVSSKGQTYTVAIARFTSNWQLRLLPVARPEDRRKIEKLCTGMAWENHKSLASLANGSETVLAAKQRTTPLWGQGKNRKR